MVALLVLKGVAIILSEADPSFVPPATFLFALGMVGLHARFEGRGGLLGRIGVLLAWVAVAAPAVNPIGLALPMPTPGDPDAPTLLEATYMVAFPGILVGLLLLGIAALRAGSYLRAGESCRWRSAYSGSPCKVSGS